jgi:hypothetical protein
VAKPLDQLFQLPLSEFTAARNLFAKAAADGGAAIKALEKPSVPAWAVNQLYWRDRRTYDRLIKASERLRAAHAQALSGKKIDLPMIELQHRAALKEAADSVRRLLASAGDAATQATMKAVVDTLQALPGGGVPGQLTKALAPLGFGALGALMKRGATSTSLAEVVTFAPPKPKADEVAEAAIRAKDAAKARLQELDRKAPALKKTLAAARAAFEKAERARADLDQKIQAATAELADRRLAWERADRDARVVEDERTHLRKTVSAT